MPNAAVAVTMGEPAGIAGEITLKAWLALRTSGPAFFAIADPRALEASARALGLDVPVVPIAAPAQASAHFTEALPVLPERLSAPVTLGQPDSRNALHVVAAIDRAVECTRLGQASSVVTNPIHKGVLYETGFRHPGHTEYLAHLAGGGMHPVMMLACRELRVVPVTVHLSLAEAVRALDSHAIVRATEITAKALVSDFGIGEPTLAVAGLNPHAGESGHLGREEIDIIAPAVAALRAKGLRIKGPAPADTLFHPRARAAVDAVICMYHDQALIPLKTLDFHGGVNTTLGLPFIRTSPDHGTAFDIAGQDRADPTSLLAALRLAERIALERAKHA